MMTTPQYRLCDLLSVGESDVIGVIGAGGKHTLMYRTASELCGAGRPVVLTSTTNLHRSADYARLATVFAGSAGEWENELDAALTERGCAVVVDTTMTPNMYRGVDPATVARIRTAAPRAAVLVKADGARKRLLKAPGEREPVYPRRVDVCILVLALAAIGKPLNEQYVHRIERVRKLTTGRTVTAQTLIDVISASGGYGDCLAGQARRVLYLSGGTTPQARCHARTIIEHTRDLFHVCIFGDTLKGRFYM